MDMLRQEDYDTVETESVTTVIDENSEALQPSNKRKDLIKKIAIPLLILLAGAGTVALITLLEQPPEKKDNAVTLPGVSTVIVNSQTITFTIDSQGTIVPRTEIPLVTEVSGMVKEVSPKLQVGGFFKAGEILLSIDDSDYTAGVKQAQANLLGKQAQLTQEIAQTEQAEKEWGITGRALNEAPVLALRQPFLEKAKAEVQYAEAELAQAQRKLDRTRIRAPFDGLIKAKNIGLGQFVTTGTALAEIIAIDYVEVRLPLSDDDIAFLNLPSPQTAIESNASTSGPEVILSAKVGGKVHEWPATIVRTEGIIDSRSRVHYAVAQVDDPYGLHANYLFVEEANKLPALPVGSFVKAKIEGLTVPDVFAVPRNAFRDEDTLMVIDSENRLHFRDATVIRSDNSFVYVNSGLESGEEVITTVLPAPVAGMHVRKVNAR